MSEQQTIRTYILRQGKITIGQQKALINFLPQYAINYQETPINLTQIFANNNPVIVEIGFGMGMATEQIAQNNPHINYIGIEVHSPGVGALLMALTKHGINNLRIIKHDAIAAINNMFAMHSLAGFHIYFPDPWPKQRQHKRRLIQAAFVDLLCTKLKTNGYIHCATDDTNYAKHILAIMNANQQLRNQAIDNTFIVRPESRPLTKFELRALKLEHPIYDLMFIKT